MAGGFGWKHDGLPIELPRALNAEQRDRYTRHLLLPEVGEEGQLKLLDSRVLLLGAGGLGSPAALYLAAAGVGTLGIVDVDVVDASNLQRQIVHSTARSATPKVDSAKKTLEALNPDVDVVTYDVRLAADNIDRSSDGYDVIVDGADNFPTRYLLNDASVGTTSPSCTARSSASRARSRCSSRSWARATAASSRAAAGRARAELRRGRRARRAARHRRLDPGHRGDQARARHRRAAHRPAADVRRAGPSSARSKLRRDPDCPVCGEHPTITEYIDYEQFCTGWPTHMKIVRVPPALRCEAGGAARSRPPVRRCAS